MEMLGDGLQLTRQLFAFLEIIARFSKERVRFFIERDQDFKLSLAPGAGS